MDFWRGSHGEAKNQEQNDSAETRDEGKIRYSQPEKKIILYDVDSINDFLEKNSKDTF